MSSWKEKNLLKTIKLCTQEILLHDKKNSLARYRLSEAITEYQVEFQIEIEVGEAAITLQACAKQKKKNKKTGVSKPIKPNKPMKDTGVSKSRRRNG